jgi:hypothetical protein
MRCKSLVPTSRWNIHASAASNRPKATKPSNIRFTNRMPVSWL